jgi:transcriptional regulator with XRE-family HTH domain
MGTKYDHHHLKLPSLSGCVHNSEYLYTIEAYLSTMTDSIMTFVAQAVRERREQLGLTLRALAEKSGVSSSMISDIERGAKSPTVSTLAALAAALGVPLSSLVERAEEPAARIHVVRTAENPEFIDPASGSRRKGFGPALAGSKVEFLRYAVPAHTVAGPYSAHAAGTIEHMHLAAGRIHLKFGADSVTLEAGDSCSCLADAPHSFDNREGEAEALIYIAVERP